MIKNKTQTSKKINKKSLKISILLVEVINIITYIAGLILNTNYSLSNIIFLSALINISMALFLIIVTSKLEKNKMVVTNFFKYVIITHITILIIHLILFLLLLCIIASKSLIISLLTYLLYLYFISYIFFGISCYIIYTIFFLLKIFLLSK